MVFALSSFSLPTLESLYTITTNNGYLSNIHRKYKHNISLIHINFKIMAVLLYFLFHLMMFSLRLVLARLISINNPT